MNHTIALIVTAHPESAISRIVEVITKPLDLDKFLEQVRTSSHAVSAGPVEASRTHRRTNVVHRGAQPSPIGSTSLSPIDSSAPRSSSRLAREAEADVALAVRAEVRARDAADPAALDQVLGHRPRQRRRRAGVALPFRD